MKNRLLLLLLVFGIGLAVGWALAGTRASVNRVNTPPAPVKNTSPVQIAVSAEIDGTDRFVFTKDHVWNDHMNWGAPRDVRFNGEPWPDPAQAPPGWVAMARDLDLSRAVISSRNGRDVIALETTAEGFDLYFADSQLGKSTYEVTITIPRR